MVYTLQHMCVCAQSCPTLCNPLDYSSQGFSAHGIFQVRILEWVAISYSPTQGSKLYLLHWQADFFTTVLPGSPVICNSLSQVKVCPLAAVGCCQSFRLAPQFHWMDAVQYHTAAL